MLCNDCFGDVNFIINIMEFFERVCRFIDNLKIWFSSWNWWFLMFNSFCVFFVVVMKCILGCMYYFF